MYGSFPARFHAPVRAAVAGKRVLDLGAGSCARARILVRLGAASVLAVDAGEEMTSSPGVRCVENYFHSAEVRDAVAAFAPEVVHLAWPTPSPEHGLAALVTEAPAVVYVGRNTGGYRCGTPSLFEHFRRRSVLAYEPTPTNVLIVYGATRKRARTKLYPEEIAGLDSDWGAKDYDPGRTPVSWTPINATPEVQRQVSSGRRVPTWYPTVDLT